jgi:hypothetical protein
MTSSWAALRLDTPATYVVRTATPPPTWIVPESWDLNQQTDPVDGSTIMTGYFGGQDSLIGLLKALIDVHCPVLSVECLGSPPPESPRSDPD